MDAGTMETVASIYTGQRCHVVARDAEGKILTITIRIEVPPAFPEKYHEALVRVAAKCAVKKTIESPPQFAIETVVRD